MSRPRTISSLGALALAIVVVIAFPAGVGAAVRTPPVLRGSGYLALGDSVTFGYEEAQVVPAPTYADASSFVAYPEMIGRELGLQVSNPACPGETSASLINASAKSNGCENAYRRAFPLHVHYSGSQLAYAVSYLRAHRNVRLVSLMIGANDLFLCEAASHDGCLSASEQRPVFAAVSSNVRRILSAIRNTAHYRGQIVLVNYFSLNYSSALISAVSRGIDTAMDSAGRPFGTEVADGYGEFQRGSRIFGGDPCQAGLITRLSTGGCGVHPTYSGQALLAQAVLKAISHPG